MQPSAPPELSVLQLQKIDDICNAFEQSFKDGKSPRAEEYLGEVDATLKQALLPELIQLELHYRLDWLPAELSSRFSDVNHACLNGLAGSINRHEPPSIPGYHIIEELGRGGMGVVYLAADLNLHRHVALKMIHRSSQVNPEHHRRFLGEARAAVRLQHRNIVQIFDAGEFEGGPFLVFELVQGGTLAERIKDQPLTFRKSAELMETLCLALQFAHDRHIIHRDLKPSNILLGTDGVPRISDFGLAKLLDEDVEHTVTGVVVGTPAYMAPEQAIGLSMATSPAVDVYSLGSILYELLTGGPPFKAASVMETLELLRTVDPISPREIRRDVPRDLETICLKCLHKEPSRRYVSAQLLAEEFGRFLRGETIIARPVGSLARAVRWCQRHPLPAALAVALVMVVPGAFTGISWQWQEAVVQRTLAETNAAKFQAERDKAIKATTRAEANAAQTEFQRSLAERHLAAAESRFAKAQAPIQELIRLGVELIRQPNMETRGRQALEKASQFREALLEEKTDDPEARYITASTLQTLAWTLLEHGEFAESEHTYYKTMEILKELQEQDSDSQRTLTLMRRACLERSVALSHMDRHEAAEQSCRDSVRYAEQLVATGIDDPKKQSGLANSLANWASYLFTLDRREEAMSALLRSVDIHRSVISSHPNVNLYKAEFTLALSSLASQLWGKDRAAAEALAMEALEILRTEVGRQKHPRDEAMYLINTLNQVIGWYTSVGRLEEAEALLVEATEQAQAAMTAFPAFYGARYGYITTLVAARRLALKKKDADRAESIVSTVRLEIAAALIDFPDDMRLKELDAWFRHLWGLLLAKRGQTAEAMETILSALHDLCLLQTQSSTPGRLRGQISSVALASLKVGTRFELEREKLQAVREWVAQDPDNTFALNSLAWHQLCVRDDSLRDALAAEQSVRRAIELKADQPNYHNTLGVALYYQDRLGEAVSEFEQSLELKTPQPAADWYFLAMIESRRGKLAEARALLEKAQAWQREHGNSDEELRLILDEASNLPGLRLNAAE